MRDLVDDKQTLSNDLNKFAMILSESNLIQDCKPIYEAANRITHSNGDEWKYNCVNLKFNSISSKYSGSIPVNVDSFEILLNIEVCGKYIDQNNIVNPLTKLLFNLDIEGFDDNLEELYSSLHLDRHDYITADNFVHPSYHFTFGGNNLESKGDVFKGILVLSTPRIQHPPLDLILGIDFILQNYFMKSDIQNILDNSEYQEIIERAQYRLWRPYYASIYNRWCGSYESLNCPPDFTHNKLVPYIK